jgi:uncharacterized membrane protein
LYQFIVAVVALAVVMMLTLVVVQYSGAFTRSADTNKVKLREIPFQLWVALASVVSVVVLSGAGLYFGIEAYQRISEQTAVHGGAAPVKPSKAEF